MISGLSRGSLRRVDLDRWGAEWGFGTSPSTELRRPSQSLSPKRVVIGIRSFMKKAYDASKSRGAIATRLMMTARAADDGLSRLIDFLYSCITGCG